MKQYTIYIKVIAMLLVIAVLGVGITSLTAPPKETVTPNGSGDSKEWRIVASFYPVYITVLNLTKGIDDVTVECLVTTQVGCLHDYQMSPQERTLLESADVVVMNGAGADAAVLGAMPVSGKQIDLSQGISLLETSHDHDHDHDREEGGVNGHVWVSPRQYRKQVETLRDKLCALDPDHAQPYRANAAAYLEKIDAVGKRLENAVALLGDVPTVMFHDSLSYLTKDAGFFGMNLNIGENQSADPEALAHVTDWLEGTTRALFLYDSQYQQVPYEELRAIPEEATVLSVDTCVMGQVHPDRWLEAMTTLCEDLEEAA